VRLSRDLTLANTITEEIYPKVSPDVRLNVSLMNWGARPEIYDFRCRTNLATYSELDFKAQNRNPAW